MVGMTENQKLIKGGQMICNYLERDGAGMYCKLLPMQDDKDYPHKYWRVFCYGNFDHVNCQARLNGKMETNEKKQCHCADGQGGPCSFCMEAKFNL